MSADQDYHDQGVHIEVNKEAQTLDIHFTNIPYDMLNETLLQMAEPAWRQQVLDTVAIGKVGVDMGMQKTRRRFMLKEVEDEIP